MSCECNESAFNKLRECWSRHHNQDMQECKCCCSGLKPKSKVKGKFGIAYVIDTPNRKCKPCGWEVEFNDTLSEVESNCKKMMNWVTCPPLGGCQNNKTNMCCCSEDAKKLLNNIQPPCCQFKRDDDSCRCCKEKKTCGDGCCKKGRQPICCCERPVKKNQCCCNVGSNKNAVQCCPKSKPKCSCCIAQDEQGRCFESQKRCTECCCAISSKEKNKQCFCNHQECDSDEECCCTKTKKKPKCCCQDSDSQSSLDSCGCKSNRKDLCCSCNCKRIGETKRDKRKKQKQVESKRDGRKGKSKETTGSKDKSYTKPKPSKNLQSPHPKRERYKGNEKTPFTMTAHNVPEENSDTGQEQLLKDFYAELNEKIQNMEKPQENVGDTKESADNLEVIVDRGDSEPDYDSPKTSVENTPKKTEELHQFELGTKPENVSKDDDNKGS